MNLALLMLVLWLVPETASLTLEQIDDHFASRTKAWKTSLSKNKKLQREHEIGSAAGTIRKTDEGGLTGESWEVESARQG